MSLDLWVASLAWPEELMPLNTTVLPMALSKSGGMTMGGGEQIVSAGAGYWVGKMEFFLPNDRASYAWQSIRNRLRGRSGMLRVPGYGTPSRPWTTTALIAASAADVAATPAKVIATHSDDATFSDGSGYVNSRWNVRLVNSAAAQDEVIRIQVMAGDYPLPGALFSRYGKMHRAQEVIPTGTANVFDVSIWPPLRSAWNAGILLEADRPTCLMRMTGDDEGGNASGEYTVSISLREAV